jgi:hypothetical protein
MSVSNSMKAPQDPAVDAAIAEFLAKGGKIQYCAPNASGRVEGTEYSAWGAPRKAGRPPASTPTPTIDDDL